MNGLVEGTPVEGTVREVVPSILHHKEDGNLVGHSPKGGEGNRGREPEELGHRVKQPKKRIFVSIVPQLREISLHTKSEEARR